MRLVAYTRVSTNTQAEHGQGLDIQTEAIRAWCQRNGHTLMTVCEDAGVSGSNGIEGRQGLPEALSLLESGEAEGLVIHRLDRLARVFTVQEGILATLWQTGATVFTVDGGEVLQDDPDDPMRTALRQITGVIAQLDRAMTRKRLQDGRKHKRARGGYIGGTATYGQRLVDGVLVDDPAEQEILRRIRELGSQGLSLRKVAAQLAEEGRTTRTGGAWQPRVLSRILERADAS